MNAAKEIQRRIALMNTADSWGDRGEDSVSEYS